eukprot:CCRYP_012131-RA/>CCRYP_012131-RA protein AED:0.42 eAED:0.42 QI:0/-1/0/1/-1/1/1/0/184
MTLSGIISSFQFFFTKPNSKPRPRPIATYHQPPPNVDYSTNPSVFGKILKGELPCQTYDESAHLLAFRDKTPRANFHALVIPKRYIPNIHALTPRDIELLQEMGRMGRNLLRRYEPDALARNDYICCFHIPPFNSVDHLHLHVLAPASEMPVLFRWKYKAGMRWCADDETVLRHLEGGLGGALL